MIGLLGVNLLYVGVKLANRVDNPGRLPDTTRSFLSSQCRQLSLRSLNHADQLITQFDAWLRRTSSPSSVHRTKVPPRANRKSPLDGVDNGVSLSEKDRRHSAGLMRVNHAGEIAAQALYEGQALVARTAEVRDALREAAREEADHLHWCEQRLEELGSEPSRLRRFWYVGSFAIGLLAAARGDTASLGFVAETERQVVEHLQGHIDRLPAGDARSRTVLREMVRDEIKHGGTATARGATTLPLPIRAGMRLVSKVMTKLAYRF